MAPFRNTLLYRLRSRLLRELATQSWFRRWRRNLRPSSVVCRPCTEQDLPLLAELYREMKPSAAPSEALEAATEELHGILSEGGAYLIALWGNQVVGYQKATPVRSNGLPTDRWLMRGLYVARAWRACGVAQLLVEAICRLAADCGARHIRCFVFERNAPAAALFARMGYRASLGTGEAQGYLVYDRELEPDRAEVPHGQGS